MPAGRPTKYSKEVTDKICLLISTTHKGIQAICRENDDLPSYKTVFTWLGDEDKKEFLQSYARAKEEQAELLVEQILEIADETSNDTITTDKGDIPNSEWIARSRLRVDSRKWLAAKLLPKKYGDKMEVDLNNKVVRVLVEPEDPE